MNMGLGEITAQSALRGTETVRKGVARGESEWAGKASYFQLHDAKRKRPRPAMQARAATPSPARDDSARTGNGIASSQPIFDKCLVARDTLTTHDRRA
jgi:hypothetical protein